jgi:vacuolar-type H+-ATPase subunit H
MRYREVGAERDQRYSEVKAAEEKALKVKETADLKALDLASQIQTYKDEKANELREQISSERGLYATRDDLASALREINATIKPLAEYVSGQQGRTGGHAEQRLNISTIMAVVMGLLAFAELAALLLLKK